MGPLLGISLVLGALAATAGLLVLAVLVFRNPRLPRWMRGDGMVQAVCFALTVVTATALSLAIVRLVALGMPVLGAGPLALGTMLGAAWLFCLLGRVRARLHLAETGRSPFGARPSPPGAGHGLAAH